MVARQGGGRWYVAGINAQSTSMNLSLALQSLASHHSATLIADGQDGNLSFRTETLRPSADGSLIVPLKARGGFVIRLDQR